MQLCNIEERGGKLHLGGNPWILPPEGVAERGNEAIRKYLEDVSAAEAAGAHVISHQLLKVVFFGSSAAGKTRCNTLMRSHHERWFRRRATPVPIAGHQPRSRNLTLCSHSGYIFKCAWNEISRQLVSGYRRIICEMEHFTSHASGGQPKMNICGR